MQMSWGRTEPGVLEECVQLEQSERSGGREKVRAGVQVVQELRGGPEGGGELFP